MPRTFYPRRKNYAPSFNALYKPARNAMTIMTPLESRGNRPLQMSFDEHLRALVFFHLEEHICPLSATRYSRTMQLRCNEN